MKTRERILDTARELFNLRGLKAVSVRDITTEIDISPGNFHYHFPNKEQIVGELYESMVAEIYALAASIPQDHASILYFLETHRQVFHVQTHYKFFYLNLFQLLTSFENIRKRYLARYQEERQYAKSLLQFYVEKGVLISSLNDAQIERLLDVGYVLNNSWAIDAEIHYAGDIQQKMRHYLQLCCGRLEPYLTESAHIDYQNFFDTL